mmetsp:Transcript_32040/g.43731  ORF Transcript_32040/g.43731 Transcript_32040/m.43731 type:complete len:226 (-) Transcript_32040:1063-1740(-)
MGCKHVGPAAVLAGHDALVGGASDGPELWLEGAGQNGQQGLDVGVGGVVPLDAEELLQDPLSGVGQVPVAQEEPAHPVVEQRGPLLQLGGGQLDAHERLGEGGGEGLRGHARRLQLLPQAPVAVEGPRHLAGQQAGGGLAVQLLVQQVPLGQLVQPQHPQTGRVGGVQPGLSVGLGQRSVAPQHPQQPEAAQEGGLGQLRLLQGRGEGLHGGLQGLLRARGVSFE